MKAMICPEYGGAEVLEFREVADPPSPVGSGEVAIRIAAAGVNYPDLLSIGGTYPIPSPPPFIPGIEGAGVVTDCGPDVTRLKPGDRVCWQDNTVKGCFAERIVLPEIALAAVPESVDLVTAACVPVTYGTAHFALVHRAGLKPGDILVVHGATGGVGIAAVQLGKLLGATVIATGRSPETLEQVRAYGADHVLDLTRADFRDAFYALTGGRGADIALDPVGGAAFDQSMRILAPLGRLLVVGFTSKEFPQARANILLIKGLSVIGVNYGYFRQSEPVAARRTIETVLQYIAAGQMASPINAVYPLRDVPKALERLLTRSVIGKIAIRIGDP